VPASVLRFGGFELDPASFQLRRSGRPLRLERIPLELLLLLVERRGQLVLRQEIAERIWGRDVVLDIDNALNTAIRKVRRVLRDDPARARYVETVPAKGYRFIGAVTSAAQPEVGRSAEIGRAHSGSPPAVLSIASPDSHIPEHLVEEAPVFKTALEGERKHVTVLFAHLEGVTGLVADRDPEEARKLLDPVLEYMMEAVRVYEGTVNQVLGDGIMALFGAPLAHEDHAVRACYAALRIQEMLKQPLEGVRGRAGPLIRVRVGLTSGEVVVRDIGPDLKMHYTAVGQTTHLAARMAQLAAPGSVLATADTLRLSAGYVQVKPLGRMTVKDFGEPVEVYEVTQRGEVRSRLQAAAARGFSRFVGRDAELAQLHRALEQARQGRGQVVTVVGEPGVGKSRLVFELMRSHRAVGWLVLEARPVSYGKATSYLPVIDLLRGYFRIGDRDTHRDILEKVTGKILALDRALETTLPALLALLDVPFEDPQWQGLDPSQRRQRTLDAVKRLVLRETQAQPVLVVVEDLHWIDTETQALLDSLVESLPATPLLLLVDYRPEYRHAWGSKMYYSQLRLDPLSPESAEELLDALLGLDASLEPFKPLLAGRTERNPLFVEESVRTLVETQVLLGERGAYRLAQPVHTIDVPATVQTTLASRIDRLPPEEKRLLEIAAVIGKDVPFALLHAVAGETEETFRRRVAHLQTAELLYETCLFPDPGFTFKHALTHEVTYGSLMKDRRRALHARIVDAIETLHRDRLGEHIERLAHHALRGELREKAVDYLRQAGLKAFARSVPQEARGWFEQALGILAALPENPCALEQGFEIRLELRSALAMLGEARRALERLCEAETLAQRLHDERRQGRACAFMTNAHSLLGELDEALVTGTRALEMARRLGDLRLHIPTTTHLEQAHYYRGDYEQVVELATHNIAALPADRVYEHFGAAAPASIYDRYWLVRCLTELGRFAEAAQHAAEMLRLAEPTRHAYVVGQAHLTAGWLHLHKGDWAKARSLIEPGIAAYRMGNIVLALPHAVASSAWVLAQLGEVSEALTRLREGEELLERQAARGIVDQHGSDYHWLGCAGLLLGQLDEAQSLGDRAVKFSPSHRGYAARALHLLGDIATHPDRFNAERGEAYYRKALALAEPRGMRPLVAHCHLGLGRLYRRTGKREQAQEHLIATTMYREMDMRFWLEQAEVELKELEG
jgi:class 3 adenylate cyclase/DNA-binding winged helix-turn-helix (wHTH) protein/tetratricopeptide (TPR) repeat protein